MSLVYLPKFRPLQMANYFHHNSTAELFADKNFLIVNPDNVQLVHVGSKPTRASGFTFYPTIIRFVNGAEIKVALSLNGYYTACRRFPDVHELRREFAKHIIKPEEYNKGTNLHDPNQMELPFEDTVDLD